MAPLWHVSSDASSVPYLLWPPGRGSGPAGGVSPVSGAAAPGKCLVSCGTSCATGCGTRDRVTVPLTDTAVSWASHRASAITMSELPVIEKGQAMISITRDPSTRNRLCIKISEPGMRIRAEVYRNCSLEEAQEAVAHCYGGSVHPLSPATCPLCRAMERERS